MQKNYLLLLEKLKNTESAQPGRWPFTLFVPHGSSMTLAPTYVKLFGCPGRRDKWRPQGQCKNCGAKIMLNARCYINLENFLTVSSVPCCSPRADEGCQGRLWRSDEALPLTELSGVPTWCLKMFKSLGKLSKNKSCAHERKSLG